MSAEETGALAGKVTIVVTPRERYSMAVESLESIAATTPKGVGLIYVDAGSPSHVAAKLGEICAREGYRRDRHDRYMTPNEARNTGRRGVETPYIVFVENDVVAAPGWLEALVACADDTGAEIVAPLTCQRSPYHEEIHQAGGTFAEDMATFFAAGPGERRLWDHHYHQLEKVEDVTLERGEMQACEFHCVLIRREVFEKHGDFDEKLLSTKEHIDLCMTVWQGGGKVWFEPASVVTYVLPDRHHPLRASDYRYFALRWSPAWQQASLAYFQQKWRLDCDPYFEKRKPTLGWRLFEGIARPLARRVPLIGYSYKVQTWGGRALMPFIRAWSERLAAAHARAGARAGGTR